MDHQTRTDSGVPVAVDGPFIVGLGASAGGIEALRQFFARVSPNNRTAYVVILHLSPDHDSRLAEVLQQTAPIPVSQVRQRMPIEENNVYVVPPNKMLRLESGSIDVAEITRTEQRRAPVDMFFRSLADAQGSRAVCAILSGTGPNGSAGLKWVKEYGGLVIAQSPTEAEHDEMPRNAINTGLVDYVLPVADMPAAIQAYFARVGEPRASAETLTQPDPEAMRDILTVLRVRTGHDFSSYKPGTIQRRVERRIHVRGLPSLAAYARLVRENPDEAVALMKELLISVTSFFRDPSAFEVLAARVVPKIFASKSSHDQVRVWVPACATGEEAYSLAMVLAEHANLTDPPAIQIFATDLDEHSIHLAREAFYSEAEVVDLSKERLQRFFAREPGGYRVRRDLRETVLFAHHNVIKDPPFSHLDLISCRNLLIYLNRSIQERVIETFHFALRPGGYLMLGLSESPETANDLFATVDKLAHIYESRSVSTRVALPLTTHGLVVPPPQPRQPEVRPADRISPGELHHRLLERLAPPSIVTTEEHTVVHMSESVGRYLVMSGGEPTRDILRLVKPDLRPDLRTALHEAVRERTVVTVTGVRVMLDERERHVTMRVHPVVRESDPARGYLLILFEEAEPSTRADTEELPHVERQAGTGSEQLEDELVRVRHQLRNTVEQYETQVEEAKASNEELQAMNEELRSAAEELETSKEELQSVNEELTTVNQELKVKIEELGLTNNDFQNLINSSEIGTIFLDRNLRVKLSTPAANQIFNLRRSDIGRPLTDITSHLRYDKLHEDAARVLDDLRTVDRELETSAGRWILTRVRPYRTMDDRIDGVVITFQDITERRRAEEQLRAGEERLRLLIEGATDYAVFTMNDQGIIDSWNSGAERMFGYRSDDIVGERLNVLFTSEDRAAGMPEKELKFAAEHGRSSDDRFHVRRDGSRFFCSGSTIRLGTTLGFAKIARDLSVQQQAAEALQVVQAEFELRLRERTGELEAEVLARAEAHRHVTGLLQKIVTAQEDERARIARDLHDQVGQQLTALRLSLQRHHERLTEGTGDEDIDRALDLVDRLDHDLDYLSWELRPAVLDDIGLAAALPLFVREWSEHYRVPAEFRSAGFSAGQLPHDAEIVFYRVAQEALNNVSKHAHASRVDVLLETRDATATLVVEDDGVGFDPADNNNNNKGIGLMGMQERASLVGATLEIESEPGRGTSIFLRCGTRGSTASRQS
jgi:two-component system, chemotaxis family, CheB/CheR fusion protein